MLRIHVSYRSKTVRSKDRMELRKARLRQMAALCRLASKGTDQDIEDLRGVLDHIAAEKVLDQMFTP